MKILVYAHCMVVSWLICTMIWAAYLGNWVVRLHFNLYGEGLFELVVITIMTPITMLKLTTAYINEI